MPSKVTRLFSLLPHLRRRLLHIALFSVVINLAYLLPSLYMLQVYDRVLASQSLPTLFYLTLLVVWVMLGVLVLDQARTRLLQVLGGELEERIRPALLAASVHELAEHPARQVPSYLKDLAAMRGFLSGHAVVALIDLPWVPFYVLVIALFHPVMGMVAVAGMLLLAALTVWHERHTRRSTEALYPGSRQSQHFLERCLAQADSLYAHGNASQAARL